MKSAQARKTPKFISSLSRLIGKHPQGDAFATKNFGFTAAHLYFDEAMVAASELFGCTKTLTAILRSNPRKRQHGELNVSKNIFLTPETVKIQTINNTVRALEKSLRINKFWILLDLPYPELARAIQNYSPQATDVANDLYNDSLEKLPVKELYDVFNVIHLPAVRQGSNPQLSEEMKSDRKFISNLSSSIRRNGIKKWNSLAFRKFIEILNNGKVDSAVLLDYPYAPLTQIYEKVVQHPLIQNSEITLTPRPNEPFTAREIITFLKNRLGLNPEIEIISDDPCPKMARKISNSARHQFIGTIVKGKALAIKHHELDKLINYWEKVADDPLISPDDIIPVHTYHGKRHATSIRQLLLANQHLGGSWAVGSWSHARDSYSQCPELAGKKLVIIIARLDACKETNTMHRASFMTTTIDIYHQLAREKNERLNFPNSSKAAKGGRLEA